MPTVDATKGYAGVPYAGTVGRFFVIENTVDFDALGVSSGDNVRAIPVGDGMVVIAAELEIITPSDADTSATVNLGDGGDDDRYVSGGDLKSATGTVLGNYGGNLGARYTDDDYIIVTPTYSGTVNTKGKVKVRIIGVKVA